MNTTFYKIFFCYTTRDNEITYPMLKKIKDLFSSSNIYTFIDLLDNTNPQWQIQVEHELRSSDFIFAIRTSKFLTSEWVNRELLLAKSYAKPIINIYPDMLRKLLTCTTSEELQLFLQDICNSSIDFKK